MVAEPDRYRINYRSEALSDIQEIRDYIAMDSPSQGDRYARVLIDMIMSLSRSPASLKVYEKRADPALSVRTRNIDSYIIYYRVDESARTVTILTIRHGARRQPRRFR